MSLKGMTYCVHVLPEAKIDKHVCLLSPFDELLQKSSCYFEYEINSSALFSSLAIQHYKFFHINTNRN